MKTGMTPKAVAALGIPETFRTLRKRRVTIREIAPQDAPLLIGLFDRLSTETRYLRFHSLMSNLTPQQKQAMARELSALDPAKAAALVALAQEEKGESAVAVARFSGQQDPLEADVAIVVRDDYQKDGLGTHLIRRIAERGRMMGVRSFRSVMLSTNLAVPRLLARAELPFQRKRLPGGETLLAISL